MNNKVARYTAEFDRLTCAIDDAIDAFMKDAEVLDEVDVIQALRVVKTSRHDSLSETGSTDWSDFYNNFEMDGRGTE